MEHWFERDEFVCHLIPECHWMALLSNSIFCMKKVLHTVTIE